MFTLIHGDNIQLSRNYYFSIKQQYTNYKMLEGEKVTLTDLIEAVEGDGLFSTTDAVFIESMLSKIRSKTDLDALLAYIQKEHEVPLILWEQKEIDKKQIAKLGQLTNKIFSYPQTLFQFLDALQPNNQQELITLFQKTLQTQEPELLLFMLTKQVRLLLGLKAPSKETISELTYLSSWQRGKLIQQAKRFSSEQLLRMHTMLYGFDLGYKTGSLSLPLAASLDFFLSEV